MGDASGARGYGTGVRAPERTTGVRPREQDVADLVRLGLPLGRDVDRSAGLRCGER